MKNKNIRALLMLVSALITVIIGLIRNEKILFILECLIIVLAVFFIIGSIIEKIIEKINADAKKSEEDRMKKAEEEAENAEQKDDEKTQESEEDVHGQTAGSNRSNADRMAKPDKNSINNANKAANENSLKKDIKHDTQNNVKAPSGSRKK
jgi:predicted neutral ceramidase superfamily lipid hydrolase